MEPLVTNRRCLIWLRICPPDETATRWQKLAHTIFSVTVLAAIICVVAASFAFCWKLASTDFGRSMFAFMVVVIEFSVIYMAMVGMILLRHKIGTIFDNLSTIYKDNQDADSFRFLARVNVISEWMWKNYFKIIPAAIIMNCVVAPLISILFNWFMNKNLSVQNLYHPVPYALPWNQTTPMGYVAELTFTVPGGIGYFLVNGGFLLLFISICMHHQAFYKMFKHSVDKLKQPEENNQCDAKFLCDLMRFHLSIKDWFLHTADVYSSFNAILLISNEIILAISIFYLDFQIRQNTFEVISAVSGLLMSITNLFMYCYLGKLATESYAKMPDCVYKMKWYELPIGLQKYFILIIQNTQQPLYYHGFGVIYLNLETFTKLVKSAMSYYGIIKAMSYK